MTDEGIVMMATHNVRLVILSVVVAIIASYTALELSARVTVARRVRTALWLAGGAIYGVASGRCTSSRCLPITYHDTYNLLPTVLVSMAVAVVASGAALFVVSRQTISGLQWAAGVCVMGLVLRRCTTQAWQRCN